MRQFSELLDALIFPPRRNVKLAHLSSWLRQTPHPDRGWGLAALTGELSFSHVKAGVVRELACVFFGFWFHRSDETALCLDSILELLKYGT